MRRMAVRALVFDVFGTLVDWRSTVAGAFSAGGVDDNADELADEWRSRFWPAVMEVNKGERPWANFDELHLMTLSELLVEHDLDIPAEERPRLIEAWHRLDPWPDSPSGLAALRDRHITGALSNGHTALLVGPPRPG